MKIRWRNYQVVDAFCNGVISLDEAVKAIRTKRNVSLDFIRVSLLRFFDLRFAENVGNVEDDLVADLYKAIDA